MGGQADACDRRARPTVQTDLTVPTDPPCLSGPPSPPVLTLMTVRTVPTV